MRIRFSKLGLAMCGLYGLFSAPLFVWGFSSHDTKTMVVASQLALMPAMLPLSLLHLDRFVGDRLWLNNIYYMYLMIHLGLYGLCLILEPPLGLRAMSVKIGSLLAATAALTTASIFLTTGAARTQRLAASRARELMTGLYYPVPASFETEKANSGSILASYPHDPRWRYAHAAQAYEEDRLEVAEQDLRLVLDDAKGMATFPNMVPYVRVLLARIEFDRGHHELARTMVCSWRKERTLVEGLHICP